MTALPSVFCWTKFGSEAGETPEEIFRRKENERRRNGGVFLWGIGNSVRTSIDLLIERVASPQVVFSPIIAKPAARDVSPQSVVVWRTAVGLDGREYSLPRHSLVTSRHSSSRRQHHYALVCLREDPLLRDDNGTVGFNELRNLRSGSQLGASQVTAVVQRVRAAGTSGRRYSVSLVANLVYPYFIVLSDPIDTNARGDAGIQFQTYDLADKQAAAG